MKSNKHHLFRQIGLSLVIAMASVYGVYQLSHHLTTPQWERINPAKAHYPQPQTGDCQCANVNDLRD